MIAVGLATAWAAVVAVLLAPRRAPVRVPSRARGRPGDTARAPGSGQHGSHDPPRPHVGGRPAELDAGEHRQADPGPTTPSGQRQAPSAATLGGGLRRLAGRPADHGADRRVGWAVIAAVALLPWAAPLTLLPLAWAGVHPVLASQRARRLSDATTADQLPDVVDLLALTTAAGLPVAASLCAIGSRPGGPLGEALGRAAGHIQRGGSTGSALSLVLATAGTTTRGLVDALAAHDRYGTPLGPSLQRVAIESRAHRRHQAEEAARRLPVTLLFPLVLTVLPAFALLTIVPLLAGSFGSLSP